MKKLELELQKTLRNDIELRISELTCFECYSLLHKSSQAKWQRRENSQARQLKGTCTYLQTKCFHTSITLPVLGKFNILNFTLGNVNVFNKNNNNLVTKITTLLHTGYHLKVLGFNSFSSVFLWYVFL